MTSVLVVDDEMPILRALTTSLRAHRYDVLAAPNGERALIAAAAGGIDCVILDLGLPDLDGTEVIRRLRAFSDVPVIVLSVRETQADKVSALDAGADDYLTKPFGMEELLARIRATLRRAGSAEAVLATLHFGNLEVDLGRRLVRLGDKPVHLTPTQYSLLETMVSHPGKLLTHRWLLERVWGPGYGQESQYLRAYVRQLRAKLGDEASAPTLILTEPGVGYRWIREPDPLPE